MKFVKRLARTLARRHTITGALAQGAAFSAIATASLVALGWNDGSAISLVSLLVGVGTFIGSWPAIALAASLPLSKGRRLAAWLFLVGASSHVGAALAFAVHYKSVFALWHLPFPSVGWAFQTFFTMAGALFFFAVTGLRLLLPWTLVPLVAGALAFARKRH